MEIVKQKMLTSVTLQMKNDKNRLCFQDSLMALVQKYKNTKEH